MKVLSLYSGLLFFLFTASCNSASEASSSIPSSDTSLEYSGVIEEQGMTTYQYGTHVLTNENTFYALKSENIDLNDFIDKEVVVKAEKIEGYPVDGGPDYLLVTEVKVQ